MEWTVVGVIVALVGLFVTVGAPIIRLNGNIARSNVILDRLEKELAAQKMDAKKAIVAYGSITMSKMNVSEIMKPVLQFWKIGRRYSYENDK